MTCSVDPLKSFSEYFCTNTSKMAASPLAAQDTSDKWGFGEDPDNMGPMSSADPLVDDAPLAADETTSGQMASGSGHKRTSSGDNGVSGSKTDSGREKLSKVLRSPLILVESSASLDLYRLRKDLVS